MSHTLTPVLLVIGWGKAGKTLAAKAAAAGRSVVMVERDPGMIGGACINVACIPTKALVTAAARRTDEDDPESYLTDAIEWRDALTARLNAANASMLEVAGVTTVMGEARFVGPRKVAVDTSEGPVEIEAAAVVLNTGSLPRPAVCRAATCHTSTTPSPSSTSGLSRRSSSWSVRAPWAWSSPRCSPISVAL